MILFEALSHPFMQRALIAGIVLAALLGYLGVFVVIRRMSFFSDGIAHASLAGVAAGVLLSVNPLVTAILASLVFALAIYLLERKSKVSADTAIGLIFTFGMSLGVLLMSLKRGYQPELIGFLFGNILTIRQSDLFIIAIVAFIIGLLLVLKRRQMMMLVLDREAAYLTGVNPDAYHLLIYMTLSISIVLGIKILGVVLVSALLIIPVSTSKLICRSFGRMVAYSVILSEVIVILGLFISYYFNLPTGAVIVMTGTVLFFAAFLLKKA